MPFIITGYKTSPWHRKCRPAPLRASRFFSVSEFLNWHLAAYALELTLTEEVSLAPEGLFFYRNRLFSLIFLSLKRWCPKRSPLLFNKEKCLFRSSRVGKASLSRKPGVVLGEVVYSRSPYQREAARRDLGRSWP